MNVVFLTNEYPPNVYGGAGVHVEYLARELARLCSVQVYPFGAQHIDDAQLRVRGMPSEGAPQASDPRFNKLFDTLQRNLHMAAAVQEADIVHCHTWYSHWAGCLVRQLTGARLVLTTHSLEPHRPWKVEQLGRAYNASSWIERTAYRSADGIVAVSPQMKADVVDLYEVDPARVTVIPNGIDPDEYRPTFDAEVLRRYGVDPNRPFVLFVGRITRQKGIIHLVYAIKDLIPGTQVVLAAGAPDTAEIEEEMTQEVARLQQEGRHRIVWIRAMMPRQDLIVLYSHALVFVCPSVYEPFGIINLEAMACETAVVASDVGGIPMVVKEASTGYLVSPEGDGFPERLAKRINELMTNPERCAEMGQRGRQRVEAQFSWRAVAGQTLAMYQKMAESG